MELETLLICLGAYVVLFTPIFLFIIGASGRQELTQEELIELYGCCNDDEINKQIFAGTYKAE